MPRLDRTFTANDLIRIYCRHLNDFEQQEVFLRFRIAATADQVCLLLPDEDEEDDIDQALAQLISVLVEAASYLGVLVAAVGAAAIFFRVLRPVEVGLGVILTTVETGIETLETIRRRRRATPPRPRRRPRRPTPRRRRPAA